MFNYFEILLTLSTFPQFLLVFYVADFEPTNVCWAIFSCSPEKDEVEKTIDDHTKQLLKVRNISLC